MMTLTSILRMFGVGCALLGAIMLPVIIVMAFLDRFYPKWFYGKSPKE